MAREPLLRKRAPAGTHPVWFQHRKDGATAAGLDAGFIDCLALQRGT